MDAGLEGEAAGVRASPPSPAYARLGTGQRAKGRAFRDEDATGRIIEGPEPRMTRPRRSWRYSPRLPNAVSFGIT